MKKLLKWLLISCSSVTTTSGFVLELDLYSGNTMSWLKIIVKHFFKILLFFLEIKPNLFVSEINMVQKAKGLDCFSSM